MFYGPRPFSAVSTTTTILYLSPLTCYRLRFGLKMTAIGKFILALITNISSKTFGFPVNYEKLNLPMTRFYDIVKMEDFGLNMGLNY